MGFLIKIIGSGGEVFREIEVEPGQIITLRPGEERVVFLHVDPAITDG